MTSIHNLVEQEVRRQVGPAVRKELTPNFFEVFYQQVMFQQQLNSAVQTNLPAVLQQNNGLVSQFVQSYLPEVLSQQSYFQNAIRQQEQIYLQKEQELTPRLEQATQKLIKSAVYNVSQQHYVIQKMRDTLRAEQNKELKQEIDNLKSDLSKQNKTSNFWSGLGGVVVGAVTVFFTMKNNS